MSHFAILKFKSWASERLRSWAVDRVVEAHDQCWFRHSTRDLPLSDSMNALSVGLPGRLKSRIAPRV